RLQFNTHQRLDRRDVLRAVQALERNATRLRCLLDDARLRACAFARMHVERVLHPTDERIHVLLRRLRTAGRRHQMSAQLAQRLPPAPPAPRSAWEPRAAKRGPADLRAAVVAADAVGIQHRLMGLMWIRLSRRW